MTDLDHFKEIVNLRFQLSEKALELKTAADEGKYNSLNTKIDSLSKLVYIGLGIVLALQLFLKFIIK